MAALLRGIKNSKISESVGDQYPNCTASAGAGWWKLNLALNRVIVDVKTEHYSQFTTLAQSNII